MSLFFLTINAQKKSLITPDSEKLDTVLLSNTKQLKSSDSRTGVTVYTQKDLKKYPSLFGEVDVLKVLQLSSGVQAGTEGQSSMVVRGGNNSMNLFYIDGIYLHNTSHLGGVFNYFNSDYISSVSFYKSGFKAAHGSRLSSVTAIKTKKELSDNRVVGSLGLLAAKATTSIDLKKIKTKILVSGRRTYLDILNGFLSEKNSLLGEGKQYYFYDYLIKSETRLTKKNTVSFSVFDSEDLYKDVSESRNLSINWRNTLLGATWKYRFSSKISNSFQVSKSFYKIRNKVNAFPFQYNFLSKYDVSQISNNIKLKLDKHKIEFGVQLKRIDNTPKNVAANIFNEPPLVLKNEVFTIDDTSLYVDEKWSIKDNFTLNLGARLTNYKNKSFTKWFLEPRISAHYAFKDDNAFKIGFQSLQQYMHQATVNTLNLPLDYFLPSTKNLPFQKGNQFSVGYFYDTTNFSFELGSYYKKVTNFSTFKNGSLNNLFNNNIYADVVLGTFDSYGLETSIKFEYKKISSIFNYTYSKTNASFNEINDGKKFPTVFDRPHNTNFTLNYNLNKRWSFGGLFVFTSGRNYTPVKDLRVISEFIILNFDQKNSARLPSYHRLDVSVNYKFRPRKKFKSSLNLTVYNLYNNQNIFFVNTNISGNFDDRRFLVEKTNQTLFPILPTLTWNFSF